MGGEEGEESSIGKQQKRQIERHGWKRAVNIWDK